MTKRMAISFVAILILVTVSSPAFGQAVFGSIFGTVTDPQGAAVPHAQVTVTNVGKGATDTATTNNDGNYTVTHLMPDVYSVKVEATGFKTYEQKAVPVSADKSQRVDAQVQVGSTSETLEVTAEAPQLQTDRADVATTYNEKYVEDLPTFNRNFTQFLLMSPGTQKQTGWSHAATENPQGSQQTFVDGQHFSGTNYELDGTDNQDPILGIIVVNPNLDAVTETKIALQDYDAEKGKAVAGYVSAQTKSGSNQLHGSGFWFRRSDANQARDPFTQYARDANTGRFIPQARWQQFGGSLGGPIIKNKLFFFGDYQGTRQSSGVTQQTSVPTTKVFNTCLQTTGFCDLSDYLANGSQLYDPTSGTPTSGKGGTRNPFPGNLIPNSMINTAARNVLAAMPRPTNGNLLNNFVAGGSGPFNQNAFDTRIDYTASQSLQVFGRFSLDYFSLSGAPDLGAVGGPGFGLAGLAGSSITHNYSLSTGVTKTFSSTWLADFRFGWFRYNPMTHKFFEGQNSAEAFGIPGANMGNTATSGLPAFNFDTLFPITTNPGNFGFGEGLNIGRCNCPLIEKEDQYQGAVNFTHIMGNHQFKFGADIRSATNLRVPSDANRTGQYTFSHLNTSSGDTGTGGLDLATFLLGDVTHFERFASQTLNASEHQWRYSFYGQDTWRVTPRLTVNLGLRWELYLPETVNAKGNGGLGVLDGGVVRVAGFGPWGSNFNVKNKLNAFAPRVGLAYQMNGGRTVLRAGYGRSYDIGVFGSNFGHVTTQNLPVLIHQNFGANALAGLATASNDYITAFSLTTAAPAPVYPAVPANGSLPLCGPDGTVCPRIRPTTQTLPTIDMWNLTLQQQLSNTMTLELAYVGNKGSHGFVGDNPAYNVNPPSMVGYGVLTQAERRPFYNRFAYPGFIDPGTGQTLMCCSSDLGNYFGNNANSNYNALQAKLQKNFSQGLQFIAHYTWSRALHYDSNYYAIDPRVAYGPDAQNRAQVFVFNGVYYLPFGKGKRFGGNSGRAANLVIGGWQMAGTLNWSSGLPFTPSTSFCGGEEDAGVCRPNIGVGSLNTGSGRFDPVNHDVVFYTPVDVSQGGPYRDPGVGVLGNAGFDSLTGPRSFTTDATIMKNFNLTERFVAQFRMDVFNLFNHPVYGFNSNQGNTCVAFNSASNSTCGSNAGKVTDLLDPNGMRALQFAVRLNF